VPWRASIPVICVGNPVAGGAGKTPTALALAMRLQALGHAPVFLTRGYGGRLRGPVQVDLAILDARDVGDEPLLLARLAPTVVARDRAAGARLAAGLGTVIVMDDGFQNPGLAHDLDLLVVDAAAGLGNGRVMPAGPLREPLADALARADALVLLGTGALPFDSTLPVVRGQIVPLDPPDLKGQAVVAFAGIGRPEKFFATVRDLGAEIVEARAFGDHQTYTPAMLAPLLATARLTGALPLTTAKDAVRLPPQLQPLIGVINVELAFDDEATVDAMLATMFHRFNRASGDAATSTAPDAPAQSPPASD
jgi:tetraacyldisaccharide 4'-kinase